jgi:phage-related protein
MLTFPVLKTASAVQYPLQVSESFATEVLQFLAGDEQRYLVGSGALLTWKIQLDLLDESELAAIEAFFVATSGSFESFSFTDPVSGTAYANCFIASDELKEMFTGELRTSATLTIQEGRAQ